MPEDAHEAFLVQVHDADQIRFDGGSVSHHVLDKRPGTVLRDFDGVFNAAFCEVLLGKFDVAFELVLQKLVGFRWADDVHAAFEILGHFGDR